jgi:branched-chain amino acid transport system ATP-binding protein
MALLEVRDVTVRFGGNVAVDGIALDVEVGRITGLIGPNGAGKTTLFNVITGLQAPTRGTVLVDGTDISSLRPYKRARLGMARTFQRLELFGSLTVRENIQLAASLHRRYARDPEPVGEVAARIIAQLALDDVAEVRADALPTGQGRLVELGRALAIKPRLLLLDEPASGQDERETEQFAAVLRDIAGSGMAVLLVEHDMALVMSVCEHIYVLDFGRLMASGTPLEVRNDPSVQAAYLGSAK